MSTPFFIFILVLLGSFAYAGLRGAPWVPTRANDIERFLQLAAVMPGEKVYDLGCGDGRMICAAAKEGAVAEGFEISLLPYALAKVRAFFQHGRCRIRWRDLWNVDLKDADVVYFFLMPKVFPKLKAKFERELKKGTRIISYVWPIDDWKPKTVDVMPDRPVLYLYEL